MTSTPSGPGDLICQQCPHKHKYHDRTTSRRNPGKCDVSGCACQAFAWEPYEEDPDQAWGDYKSGYTDIDGNVNEPVVEPEGVA